MRDTISDHRSTFHQLNHHHRETAVVGKAGILENVPVRVVNIEEIPKFFKIINIIILTYIWTTSKSKINKKLFTIKSINIVFKQIK